MPELLQSTKATEVQRPDSPADSLRQAGSTLPAPRSASIRAASELVSIFKEACRQTQVADAQALLAEHPELLREKAQVVDLAVAEFSQRTAAGEQLDVWQFCRRFPAFQHSVMAGIVVHRNYDAAKVLAQGAGRIWPAPGEEMLGLQLIDELGRGSFARVYLAREIDCGDRLVAVKFGPQGSFEAQTHGRLKHRNIVPIHYVEHVPNSDLSAICMDYVGETTLDDVLDQVYQDGKRPARAQAILDALAASRHPDTPAPPEEPRDSLFSRASYVQGALAIMVQVADALDHMHAKGLQHLDLKPSNVLLTAAGRPLLVDFNLSHNPQIASDAGGTPPYMSPEQLRCDLLQQGARSDLDARADVFSLGALLFELLTGRMPFGPFEVAVTRSKSAEELLKRQRGGPDDLDDRKLDLPRGLASVIAKALAFEPADRFQSASEFAAVLLPYGYEAMQSRRRLIAGGLAASLVVAAGIVSFALGRESIDESEYAAGKRHYAKGEYRQALECYDRALAQDATNWTYRYARARTLQKLEQWDLALAEFQQAPPEHKNDGRVLACMAYCYAETWQYAESIAMTLRARDVGFTSGATLHNLGVCLMRLNRNDEAYRCFSDSIDFDSNLAISHHGRAILDARRAVADASHQPLAGMNDIQRAVEISASKNGELYQVAAWLAALLARDDPRWIDRGIGFLELAIRHGFPPTEIRLEPILSTLSADPRFEVLCALPEQHRELYRAKWLLDPAPAE